MKLLVLQYHHARPGPDGNTPEMLDAHFAYIARRHRCVLPGEPLAGDRLNVCLTFDDALSDFRHTVFPLLRKHRLRALLGVAPGLIPTGADPSSNGGFCTWSELQELAGNGSVAFAAHGCTRRRLDRPGVNLHDEIVVPRSLLQARLGVRVDSFLFPAGRLSPRGLALAREYYVHVFRLGGADNPTWRRPVLHRIAAGNLRSPTFPFTRGRLALYRLRRWWNRLWWR